MLGRAGKARKYQHPRIRGILGGNVFLGHQVHAVAQRRHQADTGLAEERGQGLAGKTAVEIADGHPVECRMGTVYAPRFGLELMADFLVLRDTLAGPGRDLEHHDLATPIAVADQEGLKGMKALRQALGIIQPVDTDDQGAATHALGQAFDPGRVVRGLGHRLDVFGVDAYGELVGVKGPAKGADEMLVFLKHAAGFKLYVVAEGSEVDRRLEPHHVIGTQRADNLAVLWQHHHDLVGGERRM